MSSDDSKQEQEATEADADFIENITKEQQHNRGCQLHHIVDHEVNEEDISWVHIEYLLGIEQSLILLSSPLLHLVE